MNTKRKSQHEQIEMMVVTAILTALVAVLAYFGGFIKIGAFASVSLVLIPIVIGSAMYGPFVGAWLGGVSGLVFFATPDAAFWMGLSIPGTIITVMVKGILAGFCAGLVYKAFQKINRYLAVIIAAIVCPVVNTSIFIGGCFVFFMDTLRAGASAEGMGIGGYLIVAFVGLNFVFELLVNVVCSPAILRLINVREKKK